MQSCLNACHYLSQAAGCWAAVVPLLSRGSAKCRGAVGILLFGEGRSPGTCSSACLSLWDFPCSCLRHQGPKSRSGGHRGYHLCPSCPGLRDECAGHLEEVGVWSPPGCPLIAYIPVGTGSDFPAPTSGCAFAHMPVQCQEILRSPPPKGSSSSSSAAGSVALG